MELLFATNNKHKISEISYLLGNSIRIVSPEELNITEELPEDSDTLVGNALSKAGYLYKRTGMNVFADDTGLEVTTLGGAPGVYSARYAGEGRSFEENIDKLLKEMNGANDRSARFRTVIALIYNGSEYLFEGIVEGEITTERSGSRGFGYDPVFKAKGYDVTFAEISLSEKNMISHRALAVKELLAFLKSRNEMR